MMNRILETIGKSEFIQAVLGLLVYVIYALVIGLSLIPSIFWMAFCWKHLLISPTPAHCALFALAIGTAVLIYFLTGTVVMGSGVRILSLGIKPGRYPMISFTMVRWLIYSGIYHIAGKTILEYLPMGFVTNLFFRIIGAKIGKNVSINTWYLNDAYLLSVGDNVVIGGKSDISCHTFEKGHLLLQPVKIGNNSLIGQQCYISPGVTIGEHCIIGQRSLIRKNTEIPDKSVISTLAGLPLRAISRLEKMEE